MSTTSARPSATKRSAGRPRKAVLSRDIILAEAFKLAGERGANFSLAVLARRLGVQPSALHHYFPGREALIGGMRGQLTSRLGAHDFATQPWHEAIIGWARAYRLVFNLHPELIAEIATVPVAGEPESIADYDRIATAMLRDGVPEHLVVPSIVAIESFVIGSALDAHTPENNLEPPADVVDPAAAPTLARTEHASREAALAAGQTPALAAFELGLAALVSGLRAAAR